jgi:polyferredoxin
MMSLAELGDRPKSEKRELLLSWWEWRWKRIGNYSAEITVGFLVFAFTSWIFEKLRSQVLGSLDPFNLISSLSTLSALWVAVIVVVHVFYLPRHRELNEITKRKA